MENGIYMENHIVPLSVLVAAPAVLAGWSWADSLPGWVMLRKRLLIADSKGLARLETLYRFANATN
jgi:hypothetical protein